MWATLFPVGRVQLEAQNNIFWYENHNFLIFPYHQSTQHNMFDLSPASRQPTATLNGETGYTSIFCWLIFPKHRCCGSWASHNTPWTNDQSITGHIYTQLTHTLTIVIESVTASFAYLDCGGELTQAPQRRTLSVHAPETSEQQLKPVPECREVTVHGTNRKIIIHTYILWNMVCSFSICCSSVYFKLSHGCHMADDAP